MKTLAALKVNAGRAAALLGALANERRLMILCLLIEAGEMSAGELAREVQISQSAMSQHLARMREEKLVAARRESQTIHYRIADPNVKRMIALLKSIYCD